MTTKDKVEERIRDLVPELKICPYCHNEETGCDYCGDDFQGNEPHLEHILMAIEKVKYAGEGYFFATNGTIWHEVPMILNGGKVRFNREKVSNYDIEKSFADQKETFYEFLWSIITPQ